MRGSRRGTFTARARARGGLYERSFAGYWRRTPERTVLHALVARHAQTMFAELREDGGLPHYVERELAAYLRCGVLAHDFARVRCQTCGDEVVVVFKLQIARLLPELYGAAHGRYSSPPL